MAQIFDKKRVLLIKFAFIVIASLLVGFWVALYKVLPSSAGELSPEQPIPFSHKHHVGDDGIDCRYCHWSVARSSFAGIPSADLCMNCHSQLFTDAPVLAPLRTSIASGVPIRWVRVHKLPDFVYFDHSIHVAKEIGCEDCHGPVSEMPRIRRVASLEMQWCLSCHRTMAAKRHLDLARLTDCSTCHR